MVVVQLEKKWYGEIFISWLVLKLEFTDLQLNLGGAPMKDEEFNCNARQGRNPFAAIYSDIGAMAIPQDKEAQKYQLWEWIDNGHP